MKLLTKNTDYAIRAIMYLAENRECYISSREIAEAEHISIPFVRRILQELTKGGLVETKEGVSGGLKLKKAPKDIAITDVIKIIQGDIQLTECMFQKRLCENRNICVLRNRIKNIEAKVIAEFSDITIKTLLNDIKRGKS